MICRQMGDDDSVVGAATATREPWAGTRPLQPLQPLLERDVELAELKALIDEAGSGEGRLLLIESAAGLGKTRLLDEARSLAGDAGLRVLSARGGELERDFAFGLVRQLFEPVLARAGDGERSELLSGAAELAEPVFSTDPREFEAGAQATHTILHGLYWLVANLSEQGPLLLAIDDVHWADRPSLRFLVHLAPRLDGLGVAVALATRTGEEARDPDLAHQLSLAARAPVLRPRALSEAAAEQLINAGIGDEAGSELCAACREATAGNAFLLSELVAELRAQDKPLGEISAENVRALGPERIAAALLLRIGRVAPEAPGLARAVAVLGAEAVSEQAAALAGLPPGEARTLAHRLADASVFEHGEPLRFVHPIARTAVYEDISVEERSAMHGQAAELLASAICEPEHVAIHLLATDPAGRGETVARLRAAADAALACGAPDIAVRYLERALREPPREADHGAVLEELGQAGWMSGDPAALDRLRSATEVAAPGRARALATLGLASALADGGRFEDAVFVLEEAIEGLGDGDPDLARLLEVELATAAHLAQRTFVRTEHRLKPFAEGEIGDTAADRKLLASYAFQLLVEGRDANRVVEMATRSLEAGLLNDSTGTATQTCEALAVLVYAERFEAAEHYLDLAGSRARARGSLPSVLVAARFSAVEALRVGRLAAAEAHAREAIEVTDLAGLPPHAATFAVSILVDVLIEQDRLEEAAGELERIGADLHDPPAFMHDAPANFMTCSLLHTRALLHLATQEPSRAVSDLKLLSEEIKGWVGQNPSLIPCRSTLAIALTQLGETEEAQSLAAAELALARRWGTPRAIGVALHAGGLAARGVDAIELLGEAASVLEGSGAPLELARALIDLGSAERRAGQLTDARELLERGMDLAHHHGAAALVAEARAELRQAGARPTRAAIKGADALTPSERRVSELAADGMTNKQIAQALFVTLRTIEMHLSNAYGKLEIDSRQGLARALAA